MTLLQILKEFKDKLEAEGYELKSVGFDPDDLKRFYYRLGRETGLEGVGPFVIDEGPRLKVHGIVINEFTNPTTATDDDCSEF